MFDLSKVLDFSKIFALPNTLFISKNYGTIFQRKFKTICMFSYGAVFQFSADICGCTPFKDCNWSRSTLKQLINMSKDDPSRGEKIDLIARNTCNLKKRTVQCCGPEQTPKEVTQHNFLQDFLTSPSSTIKSKFDIYLPKC